MAAEPGLRSVGQIALNAKDVERATAFYRDQLGLKMLFTAPGLAFFDCGGVRLMLSGAEEPEFDHPSSILYFKVDDIEVSHRALAERRVEFRRPPHVIHRSPGMELWMAFFRDSEGNTLALQCERRA